MQRLAFIALPVFSLACAPLADRFGLGPAFMFGEHAPAGSEVKTCPGFPYFKLRGDCTGLDWYYVYTLREHQVRACPFGWRMVVKEDILKLKARIPSGTSGYPIFHEPARGVWILEDGVPKVFSPNGLSADAKYGSAQICVRKTSHRVRRLDPELGFRLKGRAVYWGGGVIHRAAFERKGGNRLAFRLSFSISAMFSSVGVKKGELPLYTKLPVTVRFKSNGGTNEITFLEINRDRIIGYGDVYDRRGSFHVEKYYHCGVPYIIANTPRDKTCGNRIYKNMGHAKSVELGELMKKSCSYPWEPLDYDYHDTFSFTGYLGLSHYYPSGWPNHFWMKDSKTGKMRTRGGGGWNPKIYKGPLLICSKRR